MKNTQFAHSVIAEPVVSYTGRETSKYLYLKLVDIKDMYSRYQLTIVCGRLSNNCALSMSWLTGKKIHDTKD